jgi:hypothetical protein
VDGIRNRIVKVDSSGKVTTFVQGEEGGKLSVPHHLVLDKRGNLYSAGDRDGVVWKIEADGKTTQIYPPLNWYGIGFVGSGGDPFTRDDEGKIFAINYRQFVHCQILKIGPDGRLAILAGSDWGYADGNGSQARFRNLHGAGFAWASDGALLITDNQTMVRKIESDGTVTTLAGGQEKGFSDGAAKEARFNGATGLATDAAGNVYVADSGNRCIRKIAPDGRVSSLAGSDKQTFQQPVGVAVSRTRAVYILDYVHENPVVRKITTDGIVTTIATVN